MYEGNMTPEQMAERWRADGFPDPPTRPATFDPQKFPSSIADQPRPSRETHPIHSEEWLREAQEAWDYRVASKKHRETCRAIDRTRQEKEAAAKQAKIDAANQERADAKRADLLRKLEGRYLQAGGTAAEFERDKDEILRQHLIAEALNPNGPDAQARALSLRQIARGF